MTCVDELRYDVIKFDKRLIIHNAVMPVECITVWLLCPLINRSRVSKAKCLLKHSRTVFRRTLVHCGTFPTLHKIHLYTMVSVKIISAGQSWETIDKRRMWKDGADCAGKLT